MNALILVDLQNDFLPGGALAVREGDRVIPIANTLMQRFDVTVATRDWHPADHGSFAANHAGRGVGEVIELNGLPQMLWPVHCVQHTHGAELAAGLERARIAKVFVKGTDPTVDSYSGLFDNGHRRSTGLAEWLRGRGVDEVFVCGLATDYCVKFTVIDALAEGFGVTLIEDASRGVDVTPGDSARAVEAMRAAGARVMQCAELLR